MQEEAKPSTSQICIGCLSAKDLIYEVPPQIFNLYRNIVEDEVDGDLLVIFCNSCFLQLEQIKTFKETCIKSLKFYLSPDNSITKVSEEENKFDASFVTVKIEENIEDFDSYQLNDDNDDEDKEIEAYVLPLSIKKNSTAKKGLKSSSKAKKKRGAPKPKNIANDNKKNWCSLCNVTVNEKSMSSHVLEFHMTDLSDGVHLRCLVCSGKVKKRWSLMHFSYHHNNVLNDPKTCNLPSHRFYECDYCGKKCSSKVRVKAHILTKHSSWFQCHYCTKLYSNADEFKQHVDEEKRMRRMSTLVCDICGASAATKQALEVHKERRHTNIAVSCDLCNKICSSKMTLKHHIRQYHLDLKHACEFCGKKFVDRRPLKLHVDCVHLKNNYIKCELCGKHLLGKTSMKKHKDIVHSNNFKFECKTCGRHFKLLSLLKKHQFTHINMRPFNCNLCSTGYYMLDYLRKHYQRVHGIEYSLKDLHQVCKKIVISPEMVLQDTNTSSSAVFTQQIAVLETEKLDVV